jgi:uncharacterized protein YbjT (DUF2867 family)
MNMDQEALVPDNTAGTNMSATEDMVCSELQTSPQPHLGKILVTGATGYIGGRLVPELVARGYDVRVMVRILPPECGERWPGAEVVPGDALDLLSLVKALDGVHTAYYFIHSLTYGPARFEAFEILAAVNFREAAAHAGVARIIYLGGLGDTSSKLSDHLRTRQETCSKLKGHGGAAVTCLRAAIIVGSGSASFEMIAHLVRRLPILFIPPWGETKCQPISIRNVIQYLVGVLETPETAGRDYDVGGLDILRYRDMLQICADVFKLRRRLIPLFISSARFYSYFASLLTPVPHPIIHSLLKSGTHTVVCQENDIRDIVRIRLLPYREAISLALWQEEQDRIHTRWSDACAPSHELVTRLENLDIGTLYRRSVSINTSKSEVSLFESFSRVGGKEGWFRLNWLWKLRGTIDRVLLGAGASRGRRSSRSLRVGDVVDYWRVEDIHLHRLLLRAEMRMPGRAWLEFSVDLNSDVGNRLSVNAYYEPAGIWGHLYWLLNLPFHKLIFDDLLKQIERRA